MSKSLWMGLVIFSISLSGCKMDQLSFWKKDQTERAITEITEDNPYVTIEEEDSSFWQTSYAKATLRAKREGKLVMANFTGSDWCAWCIKLEEEVFHTPEFEAWAAENVVPLKLDYPRKKKQDREQKFQNKQLLERYAQSVKGYPSILFLDERGEVVTKMGYSKGGPEAWIRKAESRLGMTQ